mmetsp:Transcript_406/g.1197  ORF Transcript_406/g.1197 Transcript_406/m.1197 type:complete len:185 (-) Transcript_406:2738-3292(-)
MPQENFTLHTPNPPLIRMQPSHVYPHMKIFVMKERIMSWSGDSYDIKDENGTPFYRIRGRALSLVAEKRSIHNPLNDESFGTLKEKFMSLRRQQFMANSAGQTVATVRQAKKIQIIHSNAVVHWIDNEVESPTPAVIIEGNFIAHRYRMMTPDGKEFCRVDRKLFTARNVFSGRMSLWSTSRRA